MFNFAKTALQPQIISIVIWVGGGRCNGYYTLNLFDTSRPRTEDELESGDLSDTAESYIFTTDFKTLSYNY